MYVPKFLLAKGKKFEKICNFAIIKGFCIINLCTLLLNHRKAFSLPFSFFFKSVKPIHTMFHFEFQVNLLIHQNLEVEFFFTILFLYYVYKSKKEYVSEKKSNSA